MHKKVTVEDGNDRMITGVREIFKVQLPIHGTFNQEYFDKGKDADDALVYNRDRSVQFFISRKDAIAFAGLFIYDGILPDEGCTKKYYVTAVYGTEGDWIVEKEARANW